MDIGSNLVLDELTRGKELVSKLQADIESTLSANACRAAIEEILSSLEKSISMLTESSLRSRSLTESPRTEGCGRGLGVARKDRERCKNRSTSRQPKWTRKVRLGTGPGVEGPVDDGYKWRKYGQKDILAAKHPRAYFRCTHSKSQGCPATKQVQRSEDNPLAIDVAYRGTHTCRRDSTAAQVVGAATPQLHENQDLLPLSFQTGLRVKTEGLDDSSSSLSFSFELPTFSPSLTLDNCFIGGGLVSSAFAISPATSESNYFSMPPPSPPCRLSSYGGQNLQQAAVADSSDFAKVVSSAAAANSSSVLDMGSLFDSVNLDQDFLLDTW